MKNVRNHFYEDWKYEKGKRINENEECICVVKIELMKCGVHIWNEFEPFIYFFK
mgnify:CR=1 FL=1